MMRSGCTSASARASVVRRWIALVAFSLAWGTGAGAAARGFPCNESWDVRPEAEVQVELRVPRARVAWDPCDATCVWRVRATEEWAWLSLRFARPYEGPDVDFDPEGEASKDGSRVNSSSSSSEGKAEGGSGGEGGGALHLELEVRWPRPDGSWLSTRLRDYSLESVSRMRVPAARAVLTLRDPACAEEPAAAPAPAPSPSPRVRRLALAVGVVARAPGAAASAASASAAASAVLHLAPPPAALQLFAAVLGGCFCVACVVMIASCLCCNWRHKSEEGSPAAPRRRVHRPRRRRRSVGRACLLRAFHTFMRTSRRNLELEDRLPDEKGCEAPSGFKWPRPSRAYNVAWSSQDSGGGSTTGAVAVATALAAARVGAELEVLAEAEAALEEDALLQWVQSRLDRLVLAFRGSDASSDAESVRPLCPPRRPQRILMDVAGAGAAAADVAAGRAPYSPEVWWTPRNSWALSCSSSSNSSLFSCISESPRATPRPTPSPLASPPPPLASPSSPPPHLKGGEVGSNVGAAGHLDLH